MAVPTRPVQDAIIDPAWGQWVHDNLLRRINPPGADVHHPAAISIPPTAWTAITWVDTDELRDVGGWRSGSSSRLTVPATQPAATFYEVHAAGWYVPIINEGSMAQYGVAVDGASPPAGSIGVYTSSKANNNTLWAFSGKLRLNPGQYVELKLWQNFGGPTNVMDARLSIAEASITP